MHLRKSERQKEARDYKPASVAGNKKFSITSMFVNVGLYILLVAAAAVLVA